MAVRARTHRFDRVRNRVLEAGGEDPDELIACLNRFDSVVPPAVNRVFGGVDPRALVYLTHESLQIVPDDVVVVADRADPENRIGVIAVISNKGQPVGFFVQTLVVEGELRWDDFDYGVVNPACGIRGVGQQITGLADRLAIAAGSSEGRLKTAWVGRYYWTQKKYDFATPDERTRVLDHFSRFVSFMKVDEEDLRIGDAPFAWAAITHSWDIAAVKSMKSPVKVPGLIAFDETTIVTEEIGKAFYLGDWGDKLLGERGQNLFVRNWKGVRQRS
ncbi:MAG: hypothetical protein H7Z43_10430 [Clostridia bacterium]|nr:hypothetical protein [Deltaproteobacteria bacterium]